MTVSPEIQTGFFIEELKNRFLCTVNVGGEIVTCYIPSSCRLSNFMELSGKQVLLKPTRTPNTRTQFSVYAIRRRTTYILLNLSEANCIVCNEIGTRRFAYLGKRKSVTREYSVEDYRADLFIHESQTLVEIKGILAFDKVAVFPSVYSERAERQLQCISKLLDKGYKASYVIVSMSPCVQEIQINHSMPGFHSLFCKCIRKGMTTQAVSITLKDCIPKIKKTIKVTW